MIIDSTKSCMERVMTKPDFEDEGFQWLTFANSKTGTITLNHSDVIVIEGNVVCNVDVVFQGHVTLLPGATLTASSGATITISPAQYSDWTI